MATDKEMADFLKKGGEIKVVPPGPHLHKIKYSSGHLSPKDSNRGAQVAWTSLRISTTDQRLERLRRKRELRKMKREMQNAGFTKRSLSPL